jgi:predicted acylesterase/phospholipase RssA
MPNNNTANNQTKKFDLIDEAKIYLRGEAYNEDKVIELYKKLEDSNQFGYASEVVNKYIADLASEGKPITDAEYQVLVRNIYKDTSLSSYFKYDKAINKLRSDCDLDKSLSCETLGLAGAIYKYKWKFDRQIQNLYRSLGFYKRGYQIWVEGIEKADNKDYAYTALNYAFINELIVSQFLENFASSDAVSDETISRYNNAQAVRRKILETYIQDIDADIPILKNGVVHEWLGSTIAEAFFGLRKYKQALLFIEKHIAIQTVNWKLKTFAQQFYQIAHFQNIEKRYSKENGDCFAEEAIDQTMQQKCLLALDNKSKRAVTTNETVEKRVQKKGLALSGGGFRASLFQIGILAALAEVDELRDVEIISCVSGGSIIGTYYYLHLKKLLETKSEEEINKDDYIKIVKEIEIDFLKAVQSNLRMQIFTNVFDNLKMIFSEKYSRSYRLGSLYQKHFYLPLFNKDRADKKTNLFMSDLIISPKDAPNFSITQNNWERTNKIPQLILNATCLNTGHNWQFTASWMGEPPTYLSKDFDVKKRLRRMYYKDAPDGYKEFPIGHAVAASSCVPVMFEPLVLTKLYPKIDVELVDGGAHDNQGIASILEQECDCVYICDGSSQLPDDSKTTANEFSLFYRVDNVVQERVRETQLLDLKARKYASIIRDLKIMHLKKELPQEPLSWINCDDEPRKIMQHQIKDDDDLLAYGVMKNVQKLLSEVRTDLDSFNDIEAYALMYSGYRQTMTAFKKDINNYNNDWNFLQVEDYCTKPDRQKTLVEQLKISATVPFKLVKKYKALQWFLKALGIVALFLAIYFVIINWNNSKSFTYGEVAIAIAIIVLGIFSKFLAKLLDINGYIKKLLLLIALASLGWLIFNAYIIFFNPWYNRIGRMKRKVVAPSNG